MNYSYWLDSESLIPLQNCINPIWYSVWVVKSSADDVISDKIAKTIDNSVLDIVLNQFDNVSNQFGDISNSIDMVIAV